MSFPPPTPQSLESLARDLGIPIDGKTAEAYAQAIADMMPAWQAVADYSAETDKARKPVNREHQRPTPDDNPHNAWFVRTAIREKDSGPLAGRKIAVKDSILVAGVPMINGSNVLEGYVPQQDAEVIRRILAAGGEIVGKTHCEYFCLSGGSHTNAAGPVHNPWKRGYSAGGSSSGSAAAVAAGDVSMALGADQAGSIRMPASYSGIVGLKPTYSLVPYTGIAPIESTFDHVGPMTATVRENAELLQVIAGDDGIDPRQRHVRVGDYLGDIDKGVKGLRIGIVRESFGAANAQADVDTHVRQALDTLKRLGAEVEEVSLPMHPLGPAIWMPIAMEGLTHTILEGNGFGVSRLDDYLVDFMRWNFEHRDRLAEAPHNVKVFLLASRYVTQMHGHIPYAQAINAARKLRQHYNDALQSFDLLAMPSTPIKAQPLPREEDGIAGYLKAATEMFANTSPFDVTHHPAISLPCGFSQGLPVGMMLVGGHFDEATVYRAAHAYEQTGEGQRGRP